nr:MAG TPA: hypothetical protein [Caudoviricetes sp.]
MGYNAHTKSINEALPPGGVFLFWATHLRGLFHLCRQNVIHSVLCR